MSRIQAAWEEQRQEIQLKALHGGLRLYKGDFGSPYPLFVYSKMGQFPGNEPTTYKMPTGVVR